MWLLYLNYLHQSTYVYICVILALSYACIVAWRRYSVGHIMKFLTASPIFRNGGSSIFTLFKMTYLSSLLFCTSKDTQPSYIMTPCNVPPSHSSPSHVQSVFPPILPYNPSVPQYILKRKWQILTVHRLFQPSLLAKMSYIRNSTMHNANKYLNFK